MTGSIRLTRYTSCRMRCLQDVILRLAYVENGPDTQTLFRLMKPHTLHKLLLGRYSLEHSLRRAVNAARARHQRLQILHAFVATEAGVLSEAALDKERLATAQLRQNAKEVAERLEKCIGQARSMQDAAYVAYAQARQPPSCCLLIVGLAT